MPITTSAKKAMRQARRNQVTNYKVRAKVKKAVDTVRKGSNKAEDMQNAQSVLDRAAKSGVIHKNKASRLKSRLVALVKGRSQKTTQKKSA